MSSKNKLNSNKQEKVIANIISIGLTVAICAAVSIIAFNIAKNNYMEEHKYDDLAEGKVLLPGNLIYDEDSTLLHDIILNTLTSDTVDKKSKEELKKYLDEQNIDYSFAYEEEKSEINMSELTEEEKDNYITFLKEQGIIGDEYNIEKDGDSDLATINGKKAISYKTLHEAESAFGTKLGLYTYIDCLENYEMINAYTVGKDFLQCVYAINQDGTMISEDEDIENSEIKTITIKLSTTLSSSELIKVYSDNNYINKSTMTQDGVQIKMLGIPNSTKSSKEEQKEENETKNNTIINLAYCDMQNGNSYVLHCAEGIEEWQVKEIFIELFNNIYINSLDDEQKQLYLDNSNSKETWYNK